MEKKKSLTFLDCFCCSKVFNIADLIDMNTNSLLIDCDTIEFNDILLDVCFVKVLK